MRWFGLVLASLWCVTFDPASPMILIRCLALSEQWVRSRHIQADGEVERHSYLSPGH